MIKVNNVFGNNLFKKKIKLNFFNINSHFILNFVFYTKPYKPSFHRQKQSTFQQSYHISTQFIIKVNYQYNCNHLNQKTQDSSFAQHKKFKLKINKTYHNKIMQKSQPINLNSVNPTKNQAQQQNININISYNLNTHKIPKSILGAKKTSSKSKKICDKPPQSISNQFFSNLALNAINEGKKIVKKQNIAKKSNQLTSSYKQTKGISDKQFKIPNDKKVQQKTKKPKQLQNQQQDGGDFIISSYNYKDILKRNIQSPDIFKVQNTRKLKTQASCIDGTPTYKKLKKSSLNAKQTDKNMLFKQFKSTKENTKINNWVKQSSNQYLNKFTNNFPIKKLTNSSKTPKNKKSISFGKQKQRRIHTQQNQAYNNQPGNRHNRSCMLYSSKKGATITQPNFVQTAQHIMSTIVNGNKAPRKRAQSAYAFTRNDKKLVSKLLNMSIISSELGSSQLISSQRIKSSRNQITRKRLGLKVDQLENYHNHNFREGNFSIKQGEQQNKNLFQSSVPGNALRQYLNSIDLRIIKNIEDDTANIENFKPDHKMYKHQLEGKALIQNDLQNSEQKIKEQRIQKQRKIQKLITKVDKDKTANEFQNKKYSTFNQQEDQVQFQNSQMLSFYNKLFQNALQNKRIQQQQEKYLDSANYSQSRSSLDLNDSTKLRKQKFIIKGFEQQDNLFNAESQQGGKSQRTLYFMKKKSFQQQSSKQSNKNSIKQIYQSINQQKPLKNSLKLSFNNYKDILNQQQSKKSQQQTIQRQKINNNFNNQSNKFGFQLKQCIIDNQIEVKRQKLLSLNLNQSYELEEQQIQKKQIENEKQKDQKSEEQNLYDNQFYQSCSQQKKHKQSHQPQAQVKTRQQQLQRWNNINKFLSKKINSQNSPQDQNNLIMQELIKQSNWNKKWIQQSQQSSQITNDHNIDFQKNTQHNKINQQPIEQVPLHSKKLPKALLAKRKSNQNKFQPHYNQLCWEYNAEQLQNQIKKYGTDRQSQNLNKSKTHLTKSPFNASQQGNCSGQEQYDSKKYSQASLFKDEVIQLNSQRNVQDVSKNINFKANNNIKVEIQTNAIQNSCHIESYNIQQKHLEKLENIQDNRSKISNIQVNFQREQQKIRQKELIKRLIDSFDQEEDEDVSCEQKQINSQNRWLSNSEIYQLNRQEQKGNQFSTSNQNRIEPAQNKDSNKQTNEFLQQRVRKQRPLSRNKDVAILDTTNNKSSNHNYLQCQLSDFGVNKPEYFNKTNQINKQDQSQRHHISNESENKPTNNNEIILNNEAQQINQLLQLNDVLKMIQNEQKDIQTQFIKYNNSKPYNSSALNQQISDNLKQASFINSIKNYQNSNEFSQDILSQSLAENVESLEKQSKNTENSDKFVQIRKKRLTHIVEDIILQLIRQFARDISYILKKTTTQQKKLHPQFQQHSSTFQLQRQPNDYEKDLSPFYKADQQFQCFSPQNQRQQIIKKNQFLGKCFGIDTSFVSIQKYLKEFKDFLLNDQKIKQQMVRNINKDIGPNSLQILSYLRPQYENSQQYSANQNGSANQDKIENYSECQDEDGLFIVPSQAFSQYENYLQQKRQQENKNLQQQKKIILTQKQKRNLNYWHRGIYQSWNQFLDCQRPFGINGKPYDWVQQRKKFRQIKIEEIENRLQKGIQKLLQAISLPTGIIYDKYDIQALYSDLNHEQKIFLNQQRLSRMLAIQLLQSEQLWINYNDEMAELLVQLSRIIEESLIFQLSTQFKKLTRKRNMLTFEIRSDNQQQHKYTAV